MTDLHLGYYVALVVLPSLSVDCSHISNINFDFLTYEFGHQSGYTNGGMKITVSRSLHCKNPYPHRPLTQTHLLGYMRSFRLSDFMLKSLNFYIWVS